MAVREHLGAQAKRVIVFGHMAEGDLHINVTSDKYYTELTAKLYPFLWEWVTEHGGSISAEHGVGQAHRPYSNLGKGYQTEVAKQLKNVFDPRRILSPYKMF
ncbi:unnamed protein product [Gongylonema pulchrum]|uniref:D-2-hydroxyglutarate dehydrogenase, mitochondrial n=1 Tax=Gongylonema pulchrum TaxID=637853 RepID=A0A183DDY4_9BILA|nr:unnamed protein product [Gongylonema pulchrum]